MKGNPQEETFDEKAADVDEYGHNIKHFGSTDSHHVSSSTTESMNSGHADDVDGHESAQKHTIESERK
jgi:hypothetical protein